jgi:hypothetical protein
MTYRELFAAIQEAFERSTKANIAAANLKRFTGSQEQRDEADAQFQAADNKLDEQIYETPGLRF